MEHSNEIEELFRKYLNNRCSPEELQSLMDYFRVDDLKEAMTAMIARLLGEEEPSDPQAADDLAPRLDQLLRNIQEKKRRKG